MGLGWVGIGVGLGWVRLLAKGGKKSWVERCCPNTSLQQTQSEVQPLVHVVLLHGQPPLSPPPGRRASPARARLSPPPLRLLQRHGSGRKQKCLRGFAAAARSLAARLGRGLWVPADLPRSTTNLVFAVCLANQEGKPSPSEPGGLATSERRRFIFPTAWVSSFCWQDSQRLSTDLVWDFCRSCPRRGGMGTGGRGELGLLCQTPQRARALRVFRVRASSTSLQQVSPVAVCISQLNPPGLE